MIRLIRSLAMILSLVFCLNAVPVAGAANTYSVGVAVPVEGQAKAGIEISLYHVGETISDEGIAWLPAYEQYQVASDADSIQETAPTLAAYISRDAIKPDSSAITSPSSQALFTGLDQGVYLLIGKSFSSGSKRYDPVPALVAAPQWSETNGDWITDIQVELKSEVTDIPSGPSGNTTSVIVEKVWQGNDADRPTSVEVQLLKDGNPEATVTLSEQNGWEHRWTGLSCFHTWTVAERNVPNGYTVSVERDGKQFTITNEAGEEIPPEDPIPPIDPANPDPTDPTDPSEDPATPDAPVQPTPEEPAEGAPTLPQTGQEWKLVIFLSAAGITLIVAVLLKKNRMLLVVGTVLIAAALIQTSYNLVSDYTAGKTAEQAANKITQAISQTGNNEAVTESSMTAVEAASTPHITVDGVSYIGILNIPSLGLELPVAADWSYDLLQKSVCVYAGSMAADNFVVCGHSYRSHFGSLQQLGNGDLVTITDAGGTIREYQVEGIETLAPEAVEEMVSSGYDLTLFTCTFGGGSRIAVRCNELNGGDAGAAM